MKTKKHINCKWLMFLLGLIILSNASTMAQEDINEGEKISPDVSMNYFLKGDEEYSVKISVSHRVDRERIPLSNVLINLYLNEETKAGMMGSQNTNEEGIAVFPLVNKFIEAKDSLTSYTFIAKIYNDAQVEDGLHELIIKPAKLKMELTEDEGVRRIQLTLITSDEEGEEMGVEDAELVVYVKRSFSLLPISGDYCFTDDEGLAEVEFPENMPGDENGDLVIVSRLQEHEEYGNFELNQTANWGIPKAIQAEEEKALWASRKNAPIWLILMSNGIILVVWFVIFYIVGQIRKVHLIGKT